MANLSFGIMGLNHGSWWYLINNWYVINYNNDIFITNTINGIKFLTDNISKGLKYNRLIPAYFDNKGNHNDKLCITGLSQLAVVIKKYLKIKGQKVIMFFLIIL